MKPLTAWPSGWRRRIRVGQGAWLVLIGWISLGHVFGAPALPVRRFDVPAGPAEASLRLFIAQADVELLYSIDKIAGVRTNAVKGEFTARDALDRLIASTGLTVVKDERSGALMLGRIAGTVTAAPNSSSHSKNSNGRADPTPPMKRRTIAAVLGSWLALAPAPESVAQPGSGGTAPAAGSSSGVVEGRVYNVATGEYVRNAEIRLQGTNRTTYSEEGGRYRFVNVPAGEATLVVGFAGYSPVTSTVTVPAGQPVTRDIELGSTLSQPAPGETLKLGQYVVSAEREGNAKAIMQQRRNMNITTSVASDIFGDVAEGNVGEFLKFLPGVDVEYVDAESRGPRLGGLDPEYVGVTMDGSKLASADGFTSYGGFINGGTGAGERSVGFEQMSINSIESIEINRTTSPDMDADAPAGTINLKTKRAFDRKGRRIDWQFSLSANSEEFSFDRDNRRGDAPERLIRPNFMFDYSDVFWNQRLGVRLGVSQSKALLMEQYVQHTYDKNPTPADPRPMVLTAIQFRDGPKMVDRSTITFTSDFKATSRLVLSATAMFNAYEHRYLLNRQLTFTAAAANANANTGRSTVIGDLTDFRSNGLATNTARAVNNGGGGNYIKLTNTIMVTPKFEYTHGPLVLDGSGTYSHSKNDYEALARGTIRAETINPVVADFRATRPSSDSAEWTITQLGGPDWSRLENFTNTRIAAETDRDVVVETYQAQLNATYALPTTLPVTLKFGGKINEELRESANRISVWTYSYSGPGGGPTGSFANFPSPAPLETDFGHIKALTVANPPRFVSRTALWEEFRAHPERFTFTGTTEQYYAAYYGTVRDFRQVVPAAYAMGNTRLGKLQVQGGVRWERTETHSKEFDPLTVSELQAAGIPLSTATRRATTNAGIDFQYGSRPRVTRSGAYDNWFPSVSAKYSIRPNLQAQFGYSYAISRPPINTLAGVWDINEVAQVVVAPNPNLKPELSHNYVARLAYYFEPVGSFTFLVQQNEIDNLRIPSLLTADEFGYADDPELRNYEFQSFANGTQMYRYRNLELGYNQQLAFLPGILNSTSVNLSYSRSYANQWRPGVVPHKVTAGVGWNYQRLNLRLGAIWQDDTPLTTLFGRYQRQNVKLDLSGGVRLTRRMSLFVQGRNIFNEPQELYEGDPIRGTPAALYRYGNYGTSWVFGVKGNF
jgi:iron complex outermembrane receptor protein